MYVCVFTLANLGLLALAKRELIDKTKAYRPERIYLEGRRCVFTSEVEEKRKKLYRPNSKF